MVREWFGNHSVELSVCFIYYIFILQMLSGYFLYLKLFFSDSKKSFFLRRGNGERIPYKIPKEMLCNELFQKGYPMNFSKGMLSYNFFK